MTDKSGSGTVAAEAVGEADLPRRRSRITTVTLATFLLIAIFVTALTPRYTAEAQVLLDERAPHQHAYPQMLPFIVCGTIVSFVFMVGLLATKRRSRRVAPHDRHRTAARASSDESGAPRVHHPVRVKDGDTAPDGAQKPAICETTAVLAFKQEAQARGPDQPAAPIRVGGSPARMFTPEANDDEACRGNPAVLARRIVAAHVPGHGLRIVGTSPGAAVAADDILLGLSRILAEKGRSIIVDLNRSPAKLAELARGARDADRRAEIMGLTGLAELLAGDASFADVIHRDQGSRLHFIPAGRQEADFRDFDLILDALSETYDFVVLLSPAFPQSEIAKIMAPDADFVVLAAKDPDDAELAILETAFIEAGAREVLVGTRPREPRAVRAVA